ncbi:MAG: lysophospholipid acyltransferase family protein [Syntrophobacteraceae bacterium]
MDIQFFNIPDKLQKRRTIAAHMPFLPYLTAAALRILHWTCRFEMVGEENYRESFNGEGPKIAAFWHFSYPSILYFFRDRGYLTITSRSRDGELAARMVQRLGYFPFRGSPGKGGVAALKGIISAFQNGPGGGFVADGSQGPSQVAQRGLVLLAMYSGCPIFPVSIAADRYWRFRSWDKTLLPKPFAKVFISWGPKIQVDRRASSVEIEEYRVQLERTHNEITGQAEKAAGAFA